MWRSAIRAAHCVPLRSPRPTGRVRVGGRVALTGTTGCRVLSTIHRQSAQVGRSTHTGRPAAPARCATDVSTVMSRSSVSSIASVSVKSWIAGPSVCKSNSSAKASLSYSRSPFWTEYQLVPGNAKSGFSASRPIDRKRSAHGAGLLPTRHPFALSSHVPDVLEVHQRERANRQACLTMRRCTAWRWGASTD